MRTRTLALTLTAVTAAALLSACGGSSEAEGAKKGTPEAALAGLYQAIHDGDMAKACTFVDASAKALMDCENDLADGYDDAAIAAMGDVKIDGSKVEYSGENAARIPTAAITWPDGERHDSASSFTLNNGKWLLVVGIG